MSELGIILKLCFAPCLNLGIPLAKENTMLKLELTFVQGAVRRVEEATSHVGGKHYAEALREPDWSIVTKADLEADWLLRETLLKEFPEYG